MRIFNRIIIGRGKEAQLKNSETIIIKKSTEENFPDIKKDMPIKIQ